MVWCSLARSHVCNGGELMEVRVLRERRWPVDPVWEVVQDVRISPTECGVIRRRVEEANELQLVQGLNGYATSLPRWRGGADSKRRLSGSGQSWRGTWSRASARGRRRWLGNGRGG